MHEGEISNTVNEHYPPEVAKDLARQETLPRQVPSFAQSDGQKQSSFRRMKKTQLNLEQRGNPTFQRKHSRNECTTNELRLNFDVPSISDWYPLPRSLQPETNRSEPNSSNIKPSDAHQHSMFQTDSLPMTLKYTLHITSQNGIAPFPPSHGSVQLKDNSAYQFIEQVADARIQEHCDSSLPHESWHFRNGQCTIRGRQLPIQVYDLNSVEDWKEICRSLEPLSTFQKDLHPNLDIRWEYFSSFTHCSKTETQASTDNHLKKQDSWTIYFNQIMGTECVLDGWHVMNEEYASDPFAAGYAEFRSPPPHQPAAEILHSEETPMRGFSGRCHSCNKAQTPEWRKGPDGEGTLCNVCGLREMSHSR